MKLLNNDGAFVEYLLALAITTIPETLGNFYCVVKIVYVGQPPAAVALQEFRVGIIVSCTHGIPEIATSCMRGDGWNKQWILNSHIDLVTWKDVYN
jgi:hypothetical protein